MTAAPLTIPFCFSNRSKNLTVLGKKLMLMATPLKGIFDFHSFGKITGGGA
jgi:hypothetical protein